MIQGFGTFLRDGEPHLGFRRGDAVADLGPGSLDELLPQGRDAWERATERALDAETLAGARRGHAAAAVHRRRLRRLLPSPEHATNLGRMFRPDSEPLLPNWRYLPVGYHGRAGTVVVSGTPIRRPSGQAKPPDASAPVYGPSRRLDIEPELGFLVGGCASTLGEPVPASGFVDYVFGVVLVNDWSARDIQAWSTSRSAPSSARASATSISAWDFRWRCSRSGGSPAHRRSPSRSRTSAPSATGPTTCRSRWS